MKKAELENYVANMAVFISAMHSMANLPLPDDFNPEEQALVVRNAIKHRARIEYAKELLNAENTPEEKKDLEERMTKAAWNVVTDEVISMNEYARERYLLPHLVSENSTDQTLKSE